MFVGCRVLVFQHYFGTLVCLSQFLKACKNSVKFLGIILRRRLCEKGTVGKGEEGKGRGGGEGAI